jgi:hypothetical protein
MVEDLKKLCSHRKPDYKINLLRPSIFQQITTAKGK